jgi:hypothetical protein
MTCCRTISSIIPVVSEEASAVSPETYIICRSELASVRITGQLVKISWFGMIGSRTEIEASEKVMWKHFLKWGLNIELDL